MSSRPYNISTDYSVVPPTQAAPRLLLFILGSIVVHGLFLWQWNTTEAIAAPALGNPVINARLSAQSKPPVDPAPHITERALSYKSTIDTAAHHTTLPGKKSEAKKVALNETSSSPVTMEKPPQTTTQITEIAANAIPEIHPKREVTAAEENFLLGEIRTSLMQHLVYPLIARRRGWEGEVILGLHLKANGYISQVRITRSSGYTVLDNAALKSLNKVVRINTAQKLLNGQSMDLDLPVIYQIKEG